LSTARTVVAALACAFALACGGGTADGPAVPAPDLARAEPRVRAAVERARAALAAAGDSAEAWGHLGMVCDAHELNTAAEVCYARARTLDPADPRWPYHLAHVRELVGAEPAAVAALYREALAKRPAHAAAHLRLGRVLANTGELAAACAAYERALELDRGFALAWRGLGQALLARGLEREALDALNACAALAPDDGATRLAIAVARRRLGEGVEANGASAASLVADSLPLADAWRREVQELGESSLHLRLRGRALVESGRFAEAAPLLALARDAAPDDPGLLRLYARALAETGRGEPALRALEDSLRLDPTSPEGHALAGRVQESLGRHELAAVAYARAIDLDPHESELCLLHANALARVGRPREAAGAYERAAARGAVGADLEMNWGTVLYELGDLPGALARYARAVELDPARADAHGNLGAILEELGRTDEAVRHFRRAVELHPAHPAQARLERLGG
jgi:tetratricopeptide (TPR) repeat protein